MIGHEEEQERLKLLRERQPAESLNIVVPRELADQGTGLHSQNSLIDYVDHKYGNRLITEVDYSGIDEHGIYSLPVPGPNEEKTRYRLQSPVPIPIYHCTEMHFQHLTNSSPLMIGGFSPDPNLEQ